MSESSDNKPIILLDLAIDTAKSREELHKLIEAELQGAEREQIVAFATRAALRTAWGLESLSINNSEEIDQFYAVYLRALIAVVTVNFKLTKESQAATRAAIHTDSYFNDTTAIVAFQAAISAAYFATYAYVSDAANASTCEAFIFLTGKNKYINQLNSDLSLSQVTDLLIETNLWLDSFNILQAPNLKNLDSFWNTYLFTPALTGDLYKTPKEKLFFDAFLAIPDEIHEQQSAKAMQRFMQDYMASSGSLETTQSARLILLGNGGAGKTSIVKKIMGETLVSQEKATPRIKVRDHTIKAGTQGAKNDIELSLWDFGGQVIMHSTHSFFISSQSTYIIACNSRANEQPDRWLAMLKNRVQSHAQNRVTVLIVYTHCDFKNDEDSRDAPYRKPWRRDNALKRKFGDSFKLVFHNVDLKPEGNFYSFERLLEKIESRAVKEAQTMMDNTVRAVRDLSLKLEAQKQPFITQQDLIKQLKDELETASVDNPLDIFKLAHNYGYIFPERSLNREHRENEVEDDFIWISQKHWLTYGVYQLVNNDKAIANHGVLTQNIIEEALKVNEEQCINEKGEVFLGEPKAKEESLLYCDKGIEILRRILVSYRWAMRLNRQNELLLPLATSLDEPNEFARHLLDYHDVLEKDDPSPILMHIELVNKPSDFFFKLATYLDAHLLKPKHLWRTGAILHFYGNLNNDKTTRALLEMPENVLSLKIFGEDQESFRQLLIINIKETLKSYESQSISAHSSERLSLGKGKSEMLSSDLINSLTENEGTVERLKKQLMERGRSMSSITINGNVVGSNIDGHHNQLKNEGGIYIDSISKDLIEQLQKLAGALPENEAKVINASLVELETAVNEPDEAKKKGLIRKAIDGVKDIVTLEKGADLYTEYSPKAMELWEQLGDLVSQVS